MNSATVVLIAAGLLGLTPSGAAAQQPSRDLSAQEQAICRSDAIRFCFFSLTNAEAVRACLRSKKPQLSEPCQKLLTSRGN